MPTLSTSGFDPAVFEFLPAGWYDQRQWEAGVVPPRRIAAGDATQLKRIFGKDARLIDHVAQAAQSAGNASPTFLTMSGQEIQFSVDPRTYRLTGIILRHDTAHEMDVRLIVAALERVGESIALTDLAVDGPPGFVSDVKAAWAAEFERRRSAASNPEPGADQAAAPPEKASPSRRPTASAVRPRRKRDRTALKVVGDEAVEPQQELLELLVGWEEKLLAELREMRRELFTYRFGAVNGQT